MTAMKTNLNSELFQYCPRCGEKTFQSINKQSFYCSSCHHKYYMNAACGVAGIILNDAGEILFTVRGKEPAKGKLDLPGGFVDYDETIEEALAREIKEELNLEVVRMEYFASHPNDYEYKKVFYKVIDLVFICYLKEFNIDMDKSEIENVVFIKPQEVDLSTIGFPSIRYFVKKFQGN